MIDLSAIFSQLFSFFWWAIPLFVIAALFKSPWFKGFLGEVMVNMSARLFLMWVEEKQLVNRKREAPPFSRSLLWKHSCL